MNFVNLCWSTTWRCNVYFDDLIFFDWDLQLFFDRLKIHEMLAKEVLASDSQFSCPLEHSSAKICRCAERWEFEAHWTLRGGRELHQSWRYFWFYRLWWFLDQVLQKPFVEKPLDAEDHRVRIYYPRTDGGGMKELFRKNKANQSSMYFPSFFLFNL